MIEGIAGFVILILLVLLRIPIGFAMIVVGFAGFAAIVNVNASLAMIGRTIFDTALTHSLSVLPLFILMGNFVRRAGFADELYDAAYAFLGHFRGGLAMSTVVACAGFGAICGSSLATVATMGKVAMPSMRRFHYSDRLAAGAIAAGGTLGILIPPSVILILYGIITETDIGRLFVAGIVPGLIGVVLYSGAVWFVTRLRPEYGPAGERVRWNERVRRLLQVWGLLLLFLLIMGGIYGGVFTPTEAAGIGASGAFILALLRKSLTLRVFYRTFVESAHTAASLLFVLIGALVFSHFINVAGMPREFVAWVEGLRVSPYVILVIVLLIYLLLGCVLESLSMVILTVPTFYPVMIGLGFDPVWFGIVVVMVTEISLITPPVGLNNFVLRSTVGNDLALVDVFRGVTPFWVADIGRVALVSIWPALALWLPGHMF